MDKIKISELTEQDMYDISMGGESALNPSKACQYILILFEGNPDSYDEFYRELIAEETETDPDPWNNPALDAWLKETREELQGLYPYGVIAKKDADWWLSDEWFNLGGYLLDFDTIRHYMDDELCVKLHNKIAPCSNYFFLSSYLSNHEEVFGEKLIIN